MIDAQYHAYSNDVANIKLETIPKPLVQPGHVLIRIHVASLNPVDVVVSVSEDGVPVSPDY